jgi:hypothetical protein
MTFTIKTVGQPVLRVKDECSKRFFEEILHLPVVGQNEREMVFFSADAKDKHHMVAIMPAKEGAAVPGPGSVGMQHVSFERYGGIEDELEGRTAQRPGTVAP